ncbi:hypothetical protein FRC03_000793, partial [Tulasnella sp. 419]
MISPKVILSAKFHSRRLLAPTVMDATATAIPTPSALSKPVGHQKTNDEFAVEILDLAILTFILICVVVSIPRAIGRFSTKGAWKQGWILQHSEPTLDRKRRQVSAFFQSVLYSPAPLPLTKSSPKDSKENKGDGFDEIDLATEKPMKSAATSVQFSAMGKLAPITAPLPLIPSRDLLTAGPPTAPLRIRSLSSMCHPITRLLRKRPTLLDFTWGQLMLYAVYAIMIIVAMFVFATPKVSVRRAGWIAISQLPFVLLLASKNNILGALLGVGYERLNYIHRWVGKAIFFASLFHIVGYLVIWTQKGTLSTSVTKHISVTGWVAFGGLCILALGSIGTIRRRMYEVFWITHWIGYVILIVGVTYHVETTIFWTIASGFILGIDHVVRIIKSNYTVAKLTALPKMNCTKIEIPELKRGWRAGQHVRIKLITTKLGFLSMFSAPHPFTIASVGEIDTAKRENGEGVVLYAQSTSKTSWTGRLLTLAKGMNAEAADEKGLGNGSEIRVLIEGPYGGMGHTVFSSFSSAFIVAGGSGITFALSAVEEIIRDVERGCANTGLVHLVWVVQDPASLGPLFPKLKSLLNRSALATPLMFSSMPRKRLSRMGKPKAANADSLYSLKLKISIHYSRASATAFETEKSFKSQGVERLHLKPGRPDLVGMLDELVIRTIGLGGGNKPSKPEPLSLAKSNFGPTLELPSADPVAQPAGGLNRSNTSKSERTALADALGVNPATLI